MGFVATKIGSQNSRADDGACSNNTVFDREIGRNGVYLRGGGVRNRAAYDANNNVDDRKFFFRCRW